jgi:hypothetical protein
MTVAPDLYMIKGSLLYDLSKLLDGFISFCCGFFFFFEVYGQMIEKEIKDNIMI